MRFQSIRPRIISSPSADFSEAPSDPLELQDDLTQAAYLLRQGRVEDAISIYDQISGRATPSSEIQPNLMRTGDLELSLEALRHRAGEQLEAIQGEGGLTGARAEYLADQFVDRVLDPVLLGAMVGAGGTYRTSRAALLGLASRFGLRSRALLPATGLLAFVGEAVTFPALLRAGSHMMGRSVDPSPDAWRHEVASSFLVLGGLKLFGFFGNQAVRNFLPAGARSSLHTLIPQFAMYLGILSGHQGEQWAGLIPRQGVGQMAMESLVTLAHFNGAGRILPHLMGRRLGVGEFPGRPRSQIRDRGLLRDLVLQTQRLGVPGRRLGERADSSSRLNQSNIFMMENGNGGGGSLETGAYSPEISAQVRQMGAQYLGDLLLDKGPILWFLPAEMARELGLTVEIKTNLALSGFLFKEGVADQVIFNFVYGGSDGMDLPTRLDYAFDITEVVQKGFLIEDGPGAYRVNPQNRFFQMVWDSQLSPDPDAPSPEILRQRSRTFMTSDVEAGVPSTPHPPPPPVVQARHYPELPFSVEARVSAYPMFSKQVPAAIRGFQMGPVKAGEESMVWIQLDGEPAADGERSSVPPRPRYALLTVADAQTLGILEFIGEEFQLRSNINRLYLQESLVREPRSRPDILQTSYLDEQTTTLIRERGFSAIRETSVDSHQESVFLIQPELAESTGAGERIEREYQMIRVLPATEDQPERVVLRFMGNKNYQSGQAIWFTSLTLSTEAAVRLRLISPTREGIWRKHPEPWPIQLVTAHQLDMPVEIDIDAEPTSILDFTRGLRVQATSEALSTEEASRARQIPIGRFTLGRVDQGEGTEVLFSFYLPESMESIPFLPLRGGRGFSLSAQDALNLFLVRVTDGRGFELNPEISAIWVVPETLETE